MASARDRPRFDAFVGAWVGTGEKMKTNLYYDEANYAL